MKKLLIFLSIGFVAAFAGCETTQIIKKQPIQDGYQGIYVVKQWEGDNSVLPKNITGLVLKRIDNSYEIWLSNINADKKTAEEIEKLIYTYKNGHFHIKFGGTMILKPVENGLRGTLKFRKEPKKLFLEKIK